MLMLDIFPFTFLKCNHWVVGAAAKSNDRSDSRRQVMLLFFLIEPLCSLHFLMLNMHGLVITHNLSVKISEKQVVWKSSKDYIHY